MLGGIYSDQTCPKCGERMQDNRRDAVHCLEHPEQKATRMIVQVGRNIRRRFSGEDGYIKAFRFLTGIRFKTDEGTLDARDYQANSPLAFSKLAQDYIEIKELELQRGLLAKGTFRPIKHEIGLAISYFGEGNVKQIGFIELQKFLLSLEELSSKSIHNVRTNLHAFWSWLVRARVIKPDEKPEFPEVEFMLTRRKVVDIATQNAILQEVYNLVMPHAPRVYLAIRWLCIYVGVRPAELLGLKEKNVDLKLGCVTVEDHKTARKSKAPKTFPLLPEDIELLKKLPRAFGDLPLFRHDSAYNSNLKMGQPFGPKILYRFWKRACEKVGVEGVDLYGGTRHSAMRYYREHMSMEDVLRLSFHTVSKTGLHYVNISQNELLRGYAVRGGTPMEHGKKKAPKIRG
ncbi:conserved hypothetical protein [Syntrophobacter sp. SbD1]|nr:conserved hypothetical protein [Syntrophobacter sp. SbD1]